MWSQLVSILLVVLRWLVSRKGSASLCDMFADVTVEFDDGESIKHGQVSRVGFDELRKRITLETSKMTIQVDLRRVRSLTMCDICGVRSKQPTEVKTDG